MAPARISAFHQQYAELQPLLLGCQQRCSQHSAHCVVLSPSLSHWGRAHSAPFQLLRNRGAAQHWHFPGSHGLALLGPVTAWSLPGGELCHGFATLLLVFHIITSWTKEKNYVSQRTSRSQKEDKSRKIRHLVACGLFHFRLLPARGVGVLSKPCTFIK